MEIFRSNFTLQFTILRLNSEYKQFKMTYLQNYSWVISLLTFLLSMICSILYTVYSIRETEKYPNYFWQMFYLTLVFTGISLLFSFLFTFTKFRQNYNFLQWSCYVSMFICFFSYSFLRNYILDIEKSEIPFYILFFFVDFAGRSSLIFLHLLEFLETVILDAVMVSSLVIFYSPSFSLDPQKTHSLTYFAFFFTVEVLLSYYVTREFRIKFHFISKMKKDIKWYRSIFDTTKSGFLKITNKQVAFANSMIKTKMLRLNPTVPSNGNEEDQMLSQRTESIVTQLFSNVKEEIDIVHNRENYIFTFPNDSSDQFYEELKSRYIISGEREFIFLGIKQVALEEANALTYEIMYRYYEERECGKTHFEFIFNDVTRTKQNELKNAEFKYKSLFLSKIAHEFKNPLLCISDLAEESNDLLDKGKQNIQGEGPLDKLTKNLSLVNSYSKYLLILVKDFDYFSGALTTGTGNNVNKTNTNIEDTLNFVSDVTNGLLAKSNKKESIEFIIHKDPKLPKEVQTDETKLKQVLINLTSNSIKFTNAGQIILSAESKRGSVEFSVSDTGVGIPNEMKDKLFKPFLTSGRSRSNLLGAGLGLTIVNDVTNKIGNGIHFTSDEGVGSKFWFNIPLYEQEDMKDDFHINLIPAELNPSDCDDSKETVNLSHLVLAIENKEVISLATIHSPRQRRSNKAMNVIIADDDSFVRNSNIRIVKKVAKDMGISVNVIEAEDGNDVVDIVIKSNRMRRPIDLIISDETMTYICGLESSKILRRLVEDKKILPTPFYLVTAYENVSSREISGVFTKPLKKENVMEMLSKLIMT